AEVRDKSSASVGAHDHLVRSAANGKRGQCLAAIRIHEGSGVLRFVQNDERGSARRQRRHKERKQNGCTADAFHLQPPLRDGKSSFTQNAALRTTILPARRAATMNS